jgi:hypothetical protein
LAVSRISQRLAIDSSHDSPEIDEKTYQVKIDGRVKNKLTLDMDYFHSRPKVRAAQQNRAAGAVPVALKRVGRRYLGKECAATSRSTKRTSSSSTCVSTRRGTIR